MLYITMRVDDDDDNNKGVMAKNYDMCFFQVCIVEEIQNSKT